MASSEKAFTREIGVLFRKFFQCTVQPHIIWAITEWMSERYHNDAAQSLMTKRRDDRIASIPFGPEPYLEIFSSEKSELNVGEFSNELSFIAVAHGLIDDKSADRFLRLRKERLDEVAEKLPWLRIYHNNYNRAEFVALIGFEDEESFNRVQNVGDFLLEEYLLTGLRQPFGMSYLAGYHQFTCDQLSLTKK
jgi:hypothetical protein